MLSLYLVKAYACDDDELFKLADAIAVAQPLQSQQL